MPPAYEVLLLNTAVPQIQAAQAGDTYVVPRDIAFSAALTLSAGTANGVPYLNGSKVLTTGSALTFDGANFFGGTNTYVTGRFYAQRSSSSLNLPIAGYTDGSPGAVLTGTKGDIVAFGNAGGDGVIFANANTEQMRLTSTGLGIGTSSPGYKLDVSGQGRFLSNTQDQLTVGTTSTTAGASLTITSGNGTTSSKYSYLNFINSQSSTKTWRVGTYGEDSFVIVDGTTERLKLDSSGNLGLGVTPSAWGSVFKSLDINGGAVSATTGGALVQSGNAVFNGTNWLYKATGSATRVELNAGAAGVAWFTAPSGTAGNVISFTQALTLDANRNLLLNGTSAGASAVGTLAIFNGTAPTGSVTDGIILYAEDVSSSSELKVRDEAGNVTTLSPHNFSLIPEGPSEDMAWAYYSEKGGKRINVDMLKLARMVEKLTGEKLVYEN